MAPTSSPVRIGVIGLGQWGPNHVRNLRMVEGCEVARICDSSASRVALARRQFPGIEATRDTRSVTDAPDIDAVVVATPVVSHFPLVRRALAAGKDVLCEKPLALNSAEARALCAVARKRRRILMVGHVFLYNPCTLHLKRAIDRGTLGRIYYMDAVRTNLGPVRGDVGVVFDLASHDISIFNFLLGSRPESVSAVGGAFLQRGIEDIGFLTLTYPRGVICHVHTSWLNPRKVRQLTVVGSAKMAVWDDMNILEPVRYYDKGVLQDNYSSFGEFHMILRDGAITTPKLRLYEPLLRQDQEFVDCLRSRRQPAASGAFGSGVVRVLEAARASLGRGGRMTPIAYP
jgi:predicted dehydrogenase